MDIEAIEDERMDSDSFTDISGSPLPQYVINEPVLVRGNGNLTIFGLSNRFSTDFPQPLLARLAPEEFTATVEKINSLLRKALPLQMKWIAFGCVCCCCTLGCSLWPVVCMKSTAVTNSIVVQVSESVKHLASKMEPRLEHVPRDGCSNDFATTFRGLVLNREIHEPIVFKNIHKNWDPIQWDLERWGQLFVRNGREERLTCRVGQQNYEYNEPQWESATNSISLSWTDLHSWSDERRWAYYDYKNIIQVFEKIYFEAFEWSTLGFPERTGELGNIWIGTKGAYTPCHFDTYGCNLVSQIRGRKTWILFPPGDTSLLFPTRVPYEESSVYSQINFSCPSEAHLEALAQCTPVKVTLEPGDVLFVPPRWWHFVKSEEFTISVNTWIELPEDRKSRVEEALVRFVVGSVVSSATPDNVIDVLNPNEEDLTGVSEQQLESMLQKSSEDYFSNVNTQHLKSDEPRGSSVNGFHGIDNQSETESKKRKLDIDAPLDEFLRHFPNSGGEKLLRFHYQKSSGQLENVHPRKNEMKNKYLVHLINAIGHPSILKQISEKFLENILTETEHANTLDSNLPIAQATNGETESESENQCRNTT